MSRPVVRLRLDLSGFNELPFLPSISRCETEGLAFRSLRELGDTSSNRSALYELNKLCSKDIPGRGEFFSFEEFCGRRFGERYDPDGVILALDSESWVGLCATSDWSRSGFAFNEMTGVVRSHRRRGIALALKVLGVRFARTLGVSAVRTVHDAENHAAIAMNRRLGYVDDPAAS